MNAESLDKQVIIAKPSEHKNSYGEIDGDPIPVAVLRANIVPLSGRELYAAQQMNAETTVKVTIRYREGIRPNMTVSGGGHTYEIMAIPPSPGRKDWLTLLCKEVYPNG